MIIRASLATFTLCLIAAGASVAADSPADDSAAQDAGKPFKLTAGLYSVAGGGLPAGPGLDVNLRYSRGASHSWLGLFRSPVLGFSQLRAGWDSNYAIGPVRILPSLQIASGGFVGGSLALETGQKWFAGAGFGRTNLRNYANLNFDPNDAYSLYGGYRWREADSLSLLLVRDNRLNPDQQNLHLVWRTGLEEGRRLTLDLVAKQGTVGGQFIHAAGVSATYDWPEWFVRAAWDPKVNFTPQNMLRISSGLRF